MQEVLFTEFRKKASTFIDKVEGGEPLLILRHGRPVAKMIPVKKENKKPSWKGPPLLLSCKGVSLSQAILEERESYER